MDQVLLVSASQKSGGVLHQLLQSAGYRILTAASGGEARRLLLQAEYSVVIINAPLPDESGAGLAVHVTRSSFSGVLLLVKNELLDQTADKVEDAGVMVAGKPVSRPLFFQMLRLAQASGRRMESLQRENRVLQQKVDEIRLVSRAKCLLMQAREMNEQQAHRYIEKQAMDARMTRGEIARRILQTYEYQ